MKKLLLIALVAGGVRIRYNDKF